MKIIKFIFLICLIFSISTLISIGVLDNTLPKDYNVIDGEELDIDSVIPINAIKTNDTADKGYSATLKLLGVIPVSEVNVKVLDNYSVDVLGTPFGIKIYTEGVMVVGITDVDAEKSTFSPAKEAGLLLGDLIVSINGVKVLTNEEVASIIEQSNGNTLKFNVKRNNKNLVIKIKPEISISSGKYKAGIWVRDSSAGIGTETFYSPRLNITAGLGHGISDVDTGEILTINSGQTVTADILDITKGVKGEPGQLKGRFLNDTIGDICINNETGVFTKNSNKTQINNIKKIALKQEIKTGDAKILTTIDGSEPKYYNCRIEKVSYNNSITKNLIIKITDTELIEKTGGIVQGMSGSPIIQNNKLVGAVTHVFVNDPTCGYGIFAENMLETAQSMAYNQQLKEVS